MRISLLLNFLVAAVDNFLCCMTAIWLSSSNLCSGSLHSRSLKRVLSLLASALTQESRLGRGRVSRWSHFENFVLGEDFRCRRPNASKSFGSATVVWYEGYSWCESCILNSHVRRNFESCGIALPGFMIWSNPCPQPEPCTPSRNIHIANRYLCMTWLKSLGKLMASTLCIQTRNWDMSVHFRTVEFGSFLEILVCLAALHVTTCYLIC